MSSYLFRPMRTCSSAMISIRNLDSTQPNLRAT
jgi:hypothetical protein